MASKRRNMFYEAGDDGNRSRFISLNRDLNTIGNDGQRSKRVQVFELAAGDDRPREGYRCDEVKLKFLASRDEIIYKLTLSRQKKGGIEHLKAERECLERHSGTKGIGDLTAAILLDYFHCGVSVVPNRYLDRLEAVVSAPFRRCRQVSSHWAAVINSERLKAGSPFKPGRLGAQTAGGYSIGEGGTYHGVTAVSAGERSQSERSHSEVRASDLSAWAEPRDKSPGTPLEAEDDDDEFNRTATLSKSKRMKNYLQRKCRDVLGGGGGSEDSGGAVLRSRSASRPRRRRDAPTASWYVETVVDSRTEGGGQLQHQTAAVVEVEPAPCVEEVPLEETFEPALEELPAVEDSTSERGQLVRDESVKKAPCCAFIGGGRMCRPPNKASRLVSPPGFVKGPLSPDIPLPGR
ncbi:hypothetical protein AAG570_012097 [Ranatra chinensis]|uniref:Uncharacterized protein n=1 Tax=Ranatra chinensis TaxID=642074 RepID=A0ABD0YHU0_9HEMI